MTSLSTSRIVDSVALPVDISLYFYLYLFIAPYDNEAAARISSILSALRQLLATDEGA